MKTHQPTFILTLSYTFPCKIRHIKSKLQSENVTLTEVYKNMLLF